MRADRVSFGFVITLLSASLAYGQVTIDVSKVTCDQFAGGKVGLPRTTAICAEWVVHGKRGSTSLALDDGIPQVRAPPMHASAGPPPALQFR